MAKSNDREVAVQQSMFVGSKNRHRFFIPKGSKYSKELSTAEKSVFITPKGKRFEQETRHGKFKRFEKELKSGANAHTGKLLTEGQKGYRVGYRVALGEQAKIYNKKHGK